MPSAPPLAVSDSDSPPAPAGTYQFNGERVVVHGQQGDRAGPPAETSERGEQGVGAIGLSRYSAAPSAKPVPRSSSIETTTIGMARRSGSALAPRQHVPAVKLGQHDVQHDAGRPQATRKLQARRAVPRHDDLEAGALR